MAEDLRGSALPGLYAPDAWQVGQVIGARVRAEGLDAVAYASVRSAGGECLAGFRPNAFRQCHFIRYVQFFWNGQALLGEGLPAC